MENKVFNIEIERFSGPYFKLLDLIEERKLSINEFSLSEITDKYIEYVKSLETEGEKNIIDISKFIIIASTLMLIKAKSLFPNIAITEEEKSSIDDLEKKLLIYKSMLDASKKIKNIYNKSCLFGICNIKNKEEDIFVWDNRVSVSMIHSIAIASLLKIPKKEKLKEVAVKQVLKIEDVIESLLNRVNESISMSFKDFSDSIGVSFSDLESKKSAFIVSFLAMLELIKNGLLNAEQDNISNEINISLTVK